MKKRQLVSALEHILPDGAVLSSEEAQRPFECDGLSAYRELPLVTVLPDNIQQIQAITKHCNELHIPLVALGAGTGLSGGALPHREGILLSIAKFQRIIEIDKHNHCATVQPGVRNLAISQAAAPYILYYALVPSAQMACTIGISLIGAPQAGCCGALAQHLSAEAQAIQQIKQNIDAWWPYIEAGYAAIVITASGCGNTIKKYGYLLRDEVDYREKAEKISAMSFDISEVLAKQDLSQWAELGKNLSIAFQSPCSLQHAQQLDGQVEALLNQLGFEVKPVSDAHLCCGSAGSYSLLQPALSSQLKSSKRKASKSTGAERIVTANVGCQLYLTDKDMPVVHWIELVAEQIDHV